LRQGPRAARSGRSRLLRFLTAAAFAATAAAGPLPASAALAPTDTLTSGTLRVLHAPRHRALARQTLDAAVRPMHLPGIGARSVPDSTVIVLAPSPEAFSAATGGRAPHWAGGVAFPHERIIVVPAYPVAGVRERDAATTLRHEIAHLALRAHLPAHIPRWFDEGYAQIAAGSWDSESAWTLRVAFLLGRAPEWDSIAFSWPQGADRARLAYLLSATAVDHIRRRTGEEGFELLMAHWAEDGDLDRAVRRTFGMTLGQLEEEWRRDVRRRYGWLQGAANVGAVWFVAMLLALVAWLPKRRRNRARLERLRLEEHMLPPPRPEWDQVDYPVAEPPPTPEEHAR
jgi:hypothetical protein